MATDIDIERDETRPDPERGDAPRRGMPAGRVFIVLVVSLLLWGLLYAPELKRSAEAQPDGVRRTISLAILQPMVWLSDTVGLTSVTDSTAEALGRDPDAAVGGVVGGVPIDVDEIPTFSSAPTSSATSAPTPTPTGSPTTGPPVVEETRIRVPTNDDKLRIAVVGDSLAAGIGYFAERVFKPFFTDVVKQGRISTGLSRPDYFNWPAQMQFIVDRFRPDLTIVMVGENDQQPLQSPGGAIETRVGPDWDAGYEDRVERFAEIATSEGGHVVWVGLPQERDDARWDFRQKQNSIFERVAARLPNVTFFDTWEEFDAPDGGYTAYYRDGNKVRLIRTDDGVHFNADGYTILMERTALHVTDAFRLRPRTYET